MNEKIVAVSHFRPHFTNQPTNIEVLMSLQWIWRDVSLNRTSRCIKCSSKSIQNTQLQQNTHYVRNVFLCCTIENMKRIATGKYIWTSIEESTDCEQRFLANFVFGILGEEQERGRSYLFASKVLEVTNNTTIATFFDETLRVLSE